MCKILQQKLKRSFQTQKYSWHQIFQNKIKNGMEIIYKFIEQAVSLPPYYLFLATIGID